MPKDQQKHDLPRQTPVSCGFCRKRKLRCSREAPCSNCISRSIPCDLEHPIPQPNINSIGSESEIIERLNRLERLLVTQKIGQAEGSKQTPSGSQRSDSPQIRRVQTHSPVASVLSPQIQGIANDVAWLESIYSGQSELESKIPSNQVVFRIFPIQQITGARPYIYTDDVFSKPTRCILLPQYAEAQILLEKYLRDVNHYHHVTHVPSLASVVEEVYASLHQQGQVKAGQIILVLSIFASATHCWVRRDSERRGLFACPANANEQALIWVKACEDVLDIAHRHTNISLEGIQGSIIVFFVVANIEGISRRCRSFYSMSFFLARDLGLHRIDHPSNAAMANTLEAEIGRRIWWYLCASDWMVAARFTGALEGIYFCHPRQMITKKPLNINDEDVFDGMNRIDRPMSQPTAMSYSLHRLRLGEISRSIVDRAPLISADQGGPSLDDVIDIDTQLQMLINDIPPFFSLALSKADLQQTYELNSEQADNILQQRYMIWFFLHAQRCKLHLPYFTRGFVDPDYAASRDICVKSARFIIQTEVENVRSGLCTTTRFRFMGLLLGIFMASGVLLMDLCVNKSSPHHEKQREEVAEAFRILDDAKAESEIAAKFVESLMHILRKHKVPPPTTPSRTPQSVGDIGTLHRPTSGGEIPLHAQAEQVYGDSTGPMICPIASGAPAINLSTDINMSVDTSCTGEDLSSYFNELYQGFDRGLDVGNIDWNTIFTSLESSTFV